MSLPAPRAFALIALLLPAAAACSKPAAAEATLSAATPSIAASPPSSPTPLAGSAPIAPEGMQSIPERFLTESKNRPTEAVRVEDVFAAFQKNGATLRERRQHLGAPFLAAYCMGAQTGEDLHLSVCEYSDVRGAKEGKAMSEQAFGAVANRTLYENGKTTLTLRVGSPKDRELAGRLATAFTSLSK